MRYRNGGDAVGADLSPELIAEAEQLPDNTIVQLEDTCPFGSVTSDDILSTAAAFEEFASDGRGANPALTFRKSMSKDALAQAARERAAGKVPLAWESYFMPMANALFQGLYTAGDSVVSARTQDEVIRVLSAFVAETETRWRADYAKRQSSGRFKGMGTVSFWDYWRRAVSFLEWFKQFPRSGVPFDVFSNGIAKLGDTFYEFSTMPGVTCPGAGSCFMKPNGELGWCYSFKSGFGYAGRYFKWLQNTILVNTDEGREIIRDEFRKLESPQAVRLYVDGDVDSAGTLAFWQELVATRPEVHCYGYSKSWDIFLGYRGDWAPNYQLNLSSGAARSVDPHAVQQMLALPVARGWFSPVFNVPIGPLTWKRRIKQGKLTFAEYRSIVIKTARIEGVDGPLWVCPGACATCAAIKAGPNKGKYQHVCGSPQYKGTTVVIGLH